MSDGTSILHPTVSAALAASNIRFEAVACRPELADTAEFCANYGVPPEDACNTILVAMKTTPRTYVACLVRSDMKLDVNHRVAAEVGFKRLSFASSEEAAELSGQMIGGVSVAGLPADIPILVDRRVMDRTSVIIGGGNRSSKVRLETWEVMKLPNAKVADIAVPR